MADNYLPTQYQQYIHLSRYSRWDYDKNRRETWTKTVYRLINFICMHVDKNLGVQLDEETLARLEEAILTTSVMPSMRALMTAGPALERENVAGYNCSYIPVDSPRSFDEIL